MWNYGKFIIMHVCGSVYTVVFTVVNADTKRKRQLAERKTAPNFGPNKMLCDSKEDCQS